jgi:nitroreductase
MKEGRYMDKYQDRYLAHQKRKAELLKSSYGTPDFQTYSKEEQDTFFTVVKNRCSQRSFVSEEIDISNILYAIDRSPNSCDRKGVYPVVVSERKDKEILSGLLVGGVGWMHRADKIILLIADMDCYKNPAEKGFMPYLDAGALLTSAYLAAEVSNYGCCFVNPNIRDENKEFFMSRFGLKDNEILCGALAIGKYELKHTR